MFFVSNARTGFALSLAPAEDMIEAFEGVRLKPYLCPAGKPTIGIGCTFYEDGTPVRLTDPPITLERSKKMLRHILVHHFLPGVLRMSPSLILHQNRLCAVLSFVWNFGLGAYQSSTLRRKINQGDWMGAANQFRRWVYSGGIEYRGLVRRRKAERDLFCIDLEDD